MPHGRSRSQWTGVRYALTADIADLRYANSNQLSHLSCFESPQYPDYYEVIKNPIDLRMIVDRLHGQAREGTRRGESSSYYRTKHMLRADLLRMVCYSLSSGVFMRG